jgi:ACS family tartrate transporter-like MFS transporter
LKDVFTSSRVWLLCLIYFLQNFGGYGVQMWSPTIVKGISGQSDAVVGFINAVPYLAAGVVMLLYGRHSDQTGERRGHVAFAAISAAFGFVVASSFQNPWLAMAGLAMAFAGLKSTLGPFWALSTSFLSGTAAAGGIAFINSMGNLGGFFGPYFVGIINDNTGSNAAGLYILSAALFAMGLLSIIVSASPRHTPQWQK